MSITAKLKISDKSGASPKINLVKMLSTILHEEANYYAEGNAIFLTIKVPSKDIFIEAKRRLSPKKNRLTTIVEVVEFKEETK